MQESIIPGVSDRTLSMVSWVSLRCARDAGSRGFVTNAIYVSCIAAGVIPEEISIILGSLVTGGLLNVKNDDYGRIYITEYGNVFLAEYELNMGLVTPMPAKVTRVSSATN